MSELQPSATIFEAAYSRYFRDAIDSILEENVDFVVQGTYEDYDIQALHLAREEDPDNHAIVYKAEQEDKLARITPSWGLVMPKIVLPGQKRGRYDSEDDVVVTRQYSLKGANSPAKLLISEKRSAGEVRKTLYDKGFPGKRVESEAVKKTAQTLKKDVERTRTLTPVRLQALSYPAKHAVQTGNFG